MQILLDFMNYIYEILYITTIYWNNMDNIVMILLSVKVGYSFDLQRYFLYFSATRNTVN